MSWYQKVQQERSKGRHVEFCFSPLLIVRREDDCRSCDCKKRGYRSARDSLAFTAATSRHEELPGDENRGPSAGTDECGRDVGIKVGLCSKIVSVEVVVAGVPCPPLSRR